MDPLQFKFRLTDREFARSLRLNRAWVVPRWKIYLFVVVCVTPSLLIFYFLEAGISLIWCGVMIGVMALYAILAYIRKTGQPETYDQEVIFSDSNFCNKFSHSTTQIKWGLVEDFEETSDSFRILRLARYWLIPKRILGDQVDACREFFASVKNQPLSDVPLNIYDEIFLAKTPFMIYRFHYQMDDVQRAVKSKFQLAQIERISTPAPTTNLGGRMFIAIVIAVLVYVALFLGEPGRPPRLPKDIFILIAAWILPFLLLLAFVKLLPRRRRQREGEIPTDICELRLTTTGWAVGNRDGVVLFDWQDVSGIYSSPDFYGFKTVNQLINVIPRRIFSDQVEANRFLAQALDLQTRSKTRSEIPMAIAVESGNPYQSPMR